MKRVLMLLATVGLMSCDSGVSLIQPELEDMPPPSLAIVDGNDPDGNPFFHWLPPVAQGMPDGIGILDEELLPFLAVEICEWDGSACVGDLVAAFTSEGQGKGSERLRIKGKGNGSRHFHVNWKTKSSDLDADKIYRISVKAGPVELGFADVDVVKKMKEAKGVDRDEFVVLNGKNTLPIKFTVEEGATPTTNWASLSAGDEHSCGVRRSGEGYCWGSNSRGQLGDGTLTQRLTPNLVSGGLSFSMISARGDHHTCALSPSGDAFCWGRNEHGQVGDGSTALRLFPVEVGGGYSWSSVSAGNVYSCGMTGVVGVYCWGDNNYGRLGDGTRISRSLPSELSGGLQWSRISAGGGHSCGVTTTGDAYCWGDNTFGQRGDGSTQDSDVPVAVSGSLRWTSISAYDAHTCGITQSGEAYCWGLNRTGQLGDNSFVDKHVPTLVTGGHQWSSISAGQAHTCGVTVPGAGYCWGSNVRGELGDGSIGSRPAPGIIGGGMQWTSISAGLGHSCGVALSGEGYCWGSNGSGQLGDGTTVSRAGPTEVVVSPPA